MILTINSAEDPICVCRNYFSSSFFDSSLFDKPFCELEDSIFEAIIMWVGWLQL